MGCELENSVHCNNLDQTNHLQQTIARKVCLRHNEAEKSVVKQYKARVAVWFQLVAATSCRSSERIIQMKLVGQ